MVTEHHRTVDRIATIVEEVARSSDGLTLTELATRLGATKSSVQGLLNGLVAVGWLDRLGMTYHVGPAPHVITLLARDVATTFVRHETIAGIAEHTGLNCMLAIRLGSEAVYIDDAGHLPYLEFHARSHTRRPLLTTAAGKILTAYMPEQERKSFLVEVARTQPELVDQFLLDVDRMRRERLAFSLGGSHPELDAVATPVLVADDRIAGAVVLSGLREKMRDRIDELATYLRDTIDEISPNRA